jgi:hypothetical protein
VGKIVFLVIDKNRVIIYIIMFKNIFKRVQLKKLVFFGLALLAIVLVLRSFGLYEGMDVVVEQSSKPAAPIPSNNVPGQMYPGMQMPPGMPPMPPNFVPGQMPEGMQIPSGMPSSASQRQNIPMT